MLAKSPQRPSTPEAPTVSFPPPPLRLLPGGANPVPGRDFHPQSTSAFSRRTYNRDLTTITAILGCRCGGGGCQRRRQARRGRASWCSVATGGGIDSLNCPSNAGVLGVLLGNATGLSRPWLLILSASLLRRLQWRTLTATAFLDVLVSNGLLAGNGDGTFKPVVSVKNGNFSARHRFPIRRDRIEA